MLELLDKAAIRSKLIDNMMGHCFDHWRDYLDEDRIYLDPEGELERSYERVYGEDLPEELYALAGDPEMAKVFDDMRDTVRERAEDHADVIRMQNDSVYAQLRAVGMSVHDFV